MESNQPNPRGEQIYSLSYLPFYYLSIFTVIELEPMLNSLQKNTLFHTASYNRDIPLANSLRKTNALTDVHSLRFSLSTLSVNKSVKVLNSDLAVSQKSILTHRNRLGVDRGHPPHFKNWRERVESNHFLLCDQDNNFRQSFPFIWYGYFLR